MSAATFTEVLKTETAVLQARFPELSDALSRACVILLDGRLFPEDDGRTATVLASNSVDSYFVNGHCTCPASAYRNAPCKHRLALRLYQRVSDSLLADEERWEPDAAPAVQPPAAAPAIPADALLHIQGKVFVRFEGLLTLAYARGLLALETTVVSVSLELAVCQATARFQDGRTFTDIGDASPDNVARHLRPHFVRMAATRASARALRRALNVGHCAVEELSGDEVGH